MHGFSYVPALLVNAEVDSMGGAFGGRVELNKATLLHETIEKVQTELRQEYDVREERRRELEFLEIGGNPLDFRIGNAGSVSVQSTSLTGYHPDQFVTSEAKGSFAFTASPHGDSVESSGRPGGRLSSEANSADNLMLFDGENEFSGANRNSENRSKIAPSDRSLRVDGSYNPMELVGSVTFGLPRKAYKRRNRSRPSRDGARSGSNDVVLARGCYSSLPSSHGHRDVKGPVFDAENREDPDVSLKCTSKPASPKGGIHIHKIFVSEGQQDTELDATRAVECTSKPASPKGGIHIHKIFVSEGQQDTELDATRAVESSDELNKGGLLHVASKINAPEILLDGQLSQQSFSAAEEAPTPNEVVAPVPVTFEAPEEVISAGITCKSLSAGEETENQSSTCPINGIQIDAPIRSSACGTNGLDPQSSGSYLSQIIDGNNGAEMHVNAKDIDSNRNNDNQTSVPDEIPTIEGVELVKENIETKADNSCTSINPCDQSHQEKVLVVKADEELNGSKSALQNGAKDQVIIDGMVAGTPAGSESNREPNVSSCDNSGCENKNSCSVKNKFSLDSTASDPSEVAVFSGVCSVPDAAPTSSGPDLKLTSKADEDSILEEARIIEAKRKRILELSAATSPVDKCRKSHWAYVLEEMAWLANDFAQERLWKIAVAAQICYRVSFTSQLKKKEEILRPKVKKVAHSLAKAVMEFWHSIEVAIKEPEQQCPEKNAVGIHSYAVRFLKHNDSDVRHCQDEAPVTPDRVSDPGILDMSWKDHLTEDNLFYTVASGALESYRRTIESHVIQCERTGSSMIEEVETSACDAVADFEYQANGYEEDEGETNKYDMTVAFQDGKSSRFVQKKRKHLTNAYASRSYEVGPDPSLMHCMENKVGVQQSPLTGRRPGNNLNVSVPTKRMRTASRRVQVPNKTDASSGDTNSFQDDQSTLHGGSLVPNCLEVESVSNLEKQLPFDSADVFTRPKKKKKARHLDTAFEHRWHMDSNFQNEQRDHLRKRSENHQLESNGSNGLFVMKKPKIMRQLQDNSFDNITPIGGSAPSPVASQLSNMPNPNKFIKMLGGHDRGRKAKMLKMPSGNMVSGSPWSMFEDQALIVLVHDMGPNWELVSDAVNSTLMFNCIFRIPSECKERHKFLTDRTSDGADSSEDSGSSQPYPSTIPGIPKGSARQLFQHLKGPIEEDTLKTHFEKIIMIGQKQSYRKLQNDNQDIKKAPPHNSHTVALSQAYLNNLNRGTILRPLDLCDETTSTSDMLPLGYQESHSGGSTIPNPGTVAQMLSPPGASCAVQGSSNNTIGNSSSVPSVASVRDGRNGVPRSASLSVDEQQRVQQYKQIMPGRNIQQATISTPGTLSGTDHGVRMLPGGSGMGMVGGISRTLPVTRPGFQGIPASSMVNPGSTVSAGMVSMPSAVNMHSGVGSGQGNSMSRPRDNLHMMRPGMGQDPQRQIAVPDIQMQVSPANGQGLSFSGFASSFPNQTATHSISSYPLQHQQSHPMAQQSQVLSSHHAQGANHASSPQQQAFAMHLAKERHLQHHFLQEQQQRQFVASNSMMSHGPPQPQPQLPISSPMRNSVQMQSQTSSPASLAPLTLASSMNSTPSTPQQQQKQRLPSPGLVRNAQTAGSGLNTLMGEQRSQQQQQQFPQANRQHPQQRQLSQLQQQTKHVKGVGRGNLVIHQNIQIDPSLLNGASTNPGNQSADKAKAKLSMHGQNLYPASPVNVMQSARQFTTSQPSNQSLPQKKIYSNQATASSSSKHNHHMATQSDRSHVPPVASSPDLSSGHQDNQVLPAQKSVNQNQPALHRVMQLNQQFAANFPNKLQAIDSQTDLHPTNISSVTDAGTMLPQPCNNATNVTHLSPASAPQSNASEHSLDPSKLAISMGPMGSPSDNLIEYAPATCQGLGQRQSSANLPGAQRQQQQPPSQLRSPPSPMSKPQQQLPKSLHP